MFIINFFETNTVTNNEGTHFFVEQLSSFR